MPTLVPVDNDPFAPSAPKPSPKLDALRANAGQIQQQLDNINQMLEGYRAARQPSGAQQPSQRAGGPKMTPVDHDPFATGPAQSFTLPGGSAGAMVDPRTPQPQQPPMSSAARAFQADQEYQIAARQSTDLNVRDAKGNFTRPVLGRAYQLDDGLAYFDGPDGRPVQADKAKHVVLRDPQTNQQLVFARTADTDQNKLLSLGQVLAPGMATSPLTGGRMPQLPGRVQAGQQLNAVSQDAAAFDRLGVRPFGPAFASEPTRAIAKQLSETFAIGTPLRGALTDSLTGTANAAERIAGQMGAHRERDELGHMLQTGLDRFRSSGFDQLEPGVVQGMGINPNAPVQRQRVMSAGAANAAQQAAPIRQQIGANATQSTRGVQVPAGQPLQQTLIARTRIDDLSDAQLNAVIRAPARNTSFAARAEALYERAWRHVPALQRVDNSANPNMVAAVNTRRALGQIDSAIASQIAGQGTLDGALAARIRNPRAGNFTVADLRAIRTEVGRALSNTNPLQATLNRGQLMSLYGAVARDIEIGLETIANRAAILTTRGHNQANRAPVEEAQRAAGALRAFRTADRYFRQGMGRIERFNQIVGAQSHEQAASRLISAAKGKGRGNLGMLRSAHAALRPEEWADVSAAVLRELGRPTSGARGMTHDVGFSVQSFLTNWNNMDARARALMFGGEHVAAVEDLARVVSRMANVEATHNTSRSATNALNVSGVLGAGGAIAAGTDALATGGAALAAGFGTSALLARPSYVRWLSRYLTLRSRVGATQPSKRGALIPLVNELGRLASADPTLLPVYRSIAGENGVGQRAQEQGQQEQGAGGVQPEQNPQRQLQVPTHDPQATPPAWPAPMRLGGPVPSQQPAQMPPVPFGMPQMALPPPAGWQKDKATTLLAPGAELRNGPPVGMRDRMADLLGSAIGGDAQHARSNYQAADALSLLPFVGGPMAGFDGGQMIGRGLNQASPATVAGGAAIAGLGPFGMLRRGGGAAKGVQDEIAALETQLDHLSTVLYGKRARLGRPNPVAGTSSKQVLADDVAYRDRLQKRIDEMQGRLDAAAARTPNPFHPVPTPLSSPSLTSAVSMSGKVAGNPYVQAIPGQRGFPTKAAQKAAADRAVLNAFGGTAPAQGPWAMPKPVDPMAMTRAESELLGRTIDEINALKAAKRRPPPKS